ncbi:MAG TPA: TIGR02221 family CRISPR-associated protein [Treponemataceae bacterium]|nr:TIGR02221 family CRISPR-associated protein [Treponemataceae bacterium]
MSSKNKMNNTSITLISLIGTGMYEGKDSGYRKTVYRFSDGYEFETSLFLEALLEHPTVSSFDKILIVGTTTSDWGALIAQDDEYTDLQIRILEMRETKVFSKEAIDELQEVLAAKYKKSVVLFYHTDTVDFDTAEDVFDVYKEVAKNVSKNSKVLFDITHGFRSMPLLLYQALQYAFQEELSESTSLIYGEYNKEEKISKVRDLSNYLEYAEIAGGFKLFNARFDGRLLSEKTETLWKKGCKWLKRFTAMVQANYFLQIFELLSNLTNILNEGIPEKSPSWVQDVYESLEDLHKQLKNHEKSKLLFAFSKILAEKKLYTQAIIGLQVTVEAKAFELFGDWDELGNYDYFQEKVRPLFRDFLRNDFQEKHKDRIFNLEGVRNQVAHGGAKNKKTGGSLNAENMYNQYESFVQIVEKLLEYEV